VPFPALSTLPPATDCGPPPEFFLIFFRDAISRGGSPGRRRFFDGELSSVICAGLVLLRRTLEPAAPLPSCKCAARRQALGMFAPR